MFPFILAYSNMHFKALLVVCGLLSIAAANPLPNSAKSCSASSKYNTLACCNSAIGSFGCLIPVLSSSCDASANAYCCEVNQAGLINIGLGCINLWITNGMIPLSWNLDERMSKDLGPIRIRFFFFCQPSKYFVSLKTFPYEPHFLLKKKKKKIFLERMIFVIVLFSRHFHVQVPGHR